MALFKEFPIQKQASGIGDVVGQIRTGMMAQGRPTTLNTFRFTVDSQDVADKIAELYGGTPKPWQTTRADNIEIITDAASLEAELHSFQSEFILWGQRKPIRVCNGQTQSDDHGCECPQDYWEHREAAAEGKACKPQINARLVLKDLPDLGAFKYQSNSWALSEGANELEEALTNQPGALVRFEIEQYTTKTGQPRQKPTFTLLEKVK